MKFCEKTFIVNGTEYKHISLMSVEERRLIPESDIRLVIANSVPYYEYLDYASNQTIKNYATNYNIKGRSKLSKLELIEIIRDKLQENYRREQIRAVNNGYDLYSLYLEEIKKDE